MAWIIMEYEKDYTILNHIVHEPDTGNVANNKSSFNERSA